MKYSKLDFIVRGFLFNKGYTMHRYAQCLKYASDCLRELAMDDLKIINNAVLPLNNYSAVKIPADSMDIIGVGVENGQYVKPLTKVEGFNRNYNYDQNGNQKPFPQVSEGVSDLAYFGVPYLTFYVNSYNSRGENIGGLYGFRTDGSPFIYEVMKERNEIQFDPGLGYTRVVLTYISDGRSNSAASMIDTYAEKTIEDYMDWQLHEHNRSVSDTTRQRKMDLYVGSRTILRGRESDLTTEDIMALFRNNYNAAPKT